MLTTTQNAARHNHSEKEEHCACFHCGNPCVDERVNGDGKAFCCTGCHAVYLILKDHGLERFYEMQSGEAAGRLRPGATNRYEFLDDAETAEKLLDFSDGKVARVTLHAPSIHCVACVWLLENLYRIQPGVGASTVNFARREVSITFNPAQISLRQLVEKLASLGYEPDLRLGNLDGAEARRKIDPLYIRLGVAGFAFGNIMLFSLPSYFGLSAASEPGFHRFFAFLSFLLSLPVVGYAAADYWKSALVALRERVLNIEVPIVIGIVALFGESVWMLASGRGEGYFDSLAGLIFFLLCGRAFQRKTYERLSFDRDFRSFFPISILRKSGAVERSVPISDLVPGDRILVRNGELVPADSRLVEGRAHIDYSFVTGESEPVKRNAGDLIYAGGRLVGSAVELEVSKAVSQSYLTSLWSHDAFAKRDDSVRNSITNRMSRWFTAIVVVIALSSAGVWMFLDSAVAIHAFVSVLIVACPCALALSAPFTFGAVTRMLARNGVHLKSSGVIEAMADVDAVTFDKTGTLTSADGGSIRFIGEPLSEHETGVLFSLARHSVHPHAVKLADRLGQGRFPMPVSSFLEEAGCGIEGRVDGREVWIGSRKWLKSRGAPVAAEESGDRTASHVAIDGAYRGTFVFGNTYRNDLRGAIEALAPRCELSLLTGDNPGERPRLESLFGPAASLRFNQSPHDKLAAVQEQQARGRKVMMVGDGLNDAGALRASDVGVAVTEEVGAFSPASDAIVDAAQVANLHNVLCYSRNAILIVRLSFAISLLYNVVGVTFAATGNLSPLLSAILMPVSSITVVAFASLSGVWAARRLGLN